MPLFIQEFGDFELMLSTSRSIVADEQLRLFYNRREKIMWLATDPENDMCIESESREKSKIEPMLKKVGREDNGTVIMKQGSPDIPG